MPIATAERLITFEEYLNYDDGTDNRYELVDGELVQMSLPTFLHVLIADFINDAFKAEIKRQNLPYISLREVGARTGIRKSRITDVCVATKKQVAEMLKESAVFDMPPLLAVEVVSPESVTRDYRYKRSEYTVLGIPEYWIVDPFEAKISVLLLEEGLYEETVFTGKQRIVSPTFPELSLTVEQVLAYGNNLHVKTDTIPKKG
ncbi:MAG: Uma2 family endonuclease [Candidatus Parabeggiatoa sp. nov. 1]|nr:MAG: Uma2 family endonuclease [Gammaproteobacteria bacterium]